MSDVTYEDPDRTARIAVPSKGRLRDDTLELLATAGYRVSGLRGRGSMSRAAGLDLIEMRPRDAAAALAAGTLDGAFIATDIAMEHDLTHLPRLPLGTARSTLVVAARDADGPSTLADLDGGVVATHMPAITARFLEEAGVRARIITMGGSLEGACAAGLADAIVDNTETGTSLRQNRLRVLATIAECEAEFVHREGLEVLRDLELRIGAALDARQHRYVMLHLPSERIEDLRAVFPGLASPTVLPLAGREDLVAVHFVVGTTQLWERLAELRTMGATGIVALPPDALLP
ncbi:MAG TPA: ATP phosphoribosyltransferase [Microthrixaceae bacterium]|nr:ATP phosphoribosyltransferase [Microthrixaceae bacterium]